MEWNQIVSTHLCKCQYLQNGFAVFPSIIFLRKIRFFFVIEGERWLEWKHCPFQQSILWHIIYIFFYQKYKFPRGIDDFQLNRFSGNKWNIYRIKSVQIAPYNRIWIDNRNGKCWKFIVTPQNLSLSFHSFCLFWLFEFETLTLYYKTQFTVVSISYELYGKGDKNVIDYIFILDCKHGF